MTAKEAAEADAEARAKGQYKKEKIIIAPAPSKKSTPSPEFAGSLLDAGLPKVSGEKTNVKSKSESKSPSINADGTQEAAHTARPKETPSAQSSAAKIEAPSLSLSRTPTPSATVTLQPPP